MSAKNRSKCFLWFHVELLQVYFTQPGRYFLKLGIRSSKGERTQVQLYVNEASNPINDFEFNTDSCLQDDLEVPVKLTDSKFTFCMPAGKFNTCKLHTTFLNASQPSKVF